MKKLNLVLSTIFLNLCLIVHAYDFEAGGLYFNIVSLNDLTCEVTYGDINLGGDIIIPSQVVYKGRTLTVVGISWDAFNNDLGEGDASITGLTIPATITEIKSLAFRNCTKLKKIVFEDGENSIKLGIGPQQGTSYRGIFCQCPIETIYIGRNIELSNEKYPPFYSSYYNSSLKSATIGSKVSSISCDLFRSNNSLSSLTVLGNLQTVKSTAFYDTSLSEITLGNEVERVPFSEINQTQTIMKITSANATPPVIFTQNFSNNQFINATVIVPPSALTDYQNANVWKDFWNIQGDESTSIDAIQSDKEEKESKYYDLQGRRHNSPVQGINIVNGKKIIYP